MQKMERFIINYFILISILISSLYSLKIDIKEIESAISKNPADINNRLILARYMIENNDTNRSEVLLNEVLSIDKNNTIAKSLKGEIESIKLLRESSGINSLVQDLYNHNKYEELVSLFIFISDNRPETVKSLTEKSIMTIARVAMWEGEYRTSLKALDILGRTVNLDLYELKALDCYGIGDTICAKQYYNKLYKATGDCKYALKLVDIALEQGDIDGAKRVYGRMNSGGSGCKESGTAAKKIEKRIKMSIEEMRKRYDKDPSYENLQSLAFALYDINPSKAIELLKKHYKRYPTQKRSAILLSKMLAWSGRYKESLTLLNSDLLSGKEESILLKARVEAWEGNYTESLKLLENIIKHSDNKKRVWEAKKLKANIYLWNGEKDKAEKLFEELKKSDKKDSEVNESLLMLKGNIQPLIKKYENLLSKDPTNKELIKKVAELYHMAKKDEKAVNYYESLLEENPNDIETYRSVGELYLDMKRFYKGFGDWEYYANYLHKKKPLFQLAQRYYWYGYYDASLSVLDDLIELYPDDNKTWRLRAKILKEKPRYLKKEKKGSGASRECKKNLTMAERLYEGSLYKESLHYYGDYINCKPEDYFAREHYAYALERSGRHREAAGEFYLMQWMEKTPDIVYHYAYNLQKAGQTDKAEKIYRALLPTLPRELPPFLNNFLKKWVDAQQRLDFSLYKRMYDKNITDSEEWTLKNEARFGKNGFITLSVFDPVMYQEGEDKYRVKFYEKYASSTVTAEGYKELGILCSNDRCRIVSETFKKAPYTAPDETKPIWKEVEERLKELKNGDTHIPKDIDNTNRLIKPVIPISNDAQNIKSRILKKSSRKFEKIRQGYVQRGPFGTFADKIDRSASGKPVAPSAADRRRYRLEINGEHFSDNAGVNMNSTGVSLSYRLDNGEKLYFFTGGFDISDNGTDEKGVFYGIGLHGEKFSADIFADDGGSDTKPGWTLAYNGDIGFTSLNISIDRKNLVYTRRTACSTNLMSTKFQISGYRAFGDLRGIWWSAAYEDIEDGNRAITIQYDYTFYDHKLLEGDMSYFLSGWYLFDSMENDCYYSPDKVDNTLLGIRYEKSLNRYFRLSAKGAAGYSFIDGVNLYQGGLWIKSSPESPYEASVGCDIGSGTGVNGATGYRSTECGARFAMRW